MVRTIFLAAEASHQEPDADVSVVRP